MPHTTSSRVLSFFPAGKGLGRDVDHSAPSSDEDKNEWRNVCRSLAMPSWRGNGQFYVLILFHYEYLLRSVFWRDIL